MRKFGFSKLFFLILFSISALAISCTDNASDDDSKGSSTGGGTGGGTGTGTGGGTGTATTTGGTPAKGQVKYEIKQCGQNLESIGSGAEACASQKGSNGYTLITAKYIVAEVGYGNKGPERKYKKEILAYGGVLIDDKGKISCVGCHCLKAAESAAANKIVCPNSVVSPGLINAHEHLYFSEFGPPRQSSERYDHRHEWRKGSNGKSRIKVSANKSSRGELIGELRHMMAGATSVIGSGGRAGLLRNLDVKSQSGIPNIGKVEYETFPLGDTDGKTLNSGCDYKFTFQKDDMKSFQAFIPHISEGINYAAHNEFRCLSSDARGLISSKTAIIHGIGLSANDISLLAKRGAGLIWSPRSNISLYGQTADVLSYHRMDVPIALGTDWVASGSMNMLREISCALNLNGRHYNGFFTLDTIFEMATINGAKMAKLHEQIGSIKEDKFADIAIYKSIKDKEILLSILTAQVQDVQLVMRGGKILYGNKLDLAPLKLNRCEDLDVCSIKKTVCLEDDTAVKSGAGYKIADIYLNKENKKVDAYPLFFCKEITAEPSCNPSRPNEYNKSEPNDRDGDGMVNNEDNCPDHFNPKRPMDKDLQPDFDGDKKGDTCDICPVDPGAEANECKGYDPNDSDGDSVKNEKDNCPNIQNKDQLDTDDDGQGDVCDLCPKVKNAKGQPCPRTVVEIKTGKVKMGSNVFIPNLIITTVMPKFRF